MSQKRLAENIRIAILAVIALIIVGVVIFSTIEGWSIVDSFYFVMMTATTIGYGDFTPTHTTSKLITIFYSLIIIPFILYAFSVIAKFQVEQVYKKIHGLEKTQKEQEEDIEKTERKIARNNSKLKEYEVELDAQERELKKQRRINKEQEKELEGHQRKIRNQAKKSEEVKETIEVVEEVVTDVLKKSKGGKK